MEEQKSGQRSGDAIPLASLIIEGLGDPTFAASWQDEADTTFKPYAAAILELRHAGRVPADDRRVQKYKSAKRVIEGAIAGVREN
jgi:hypothetical protein